LSSWRSGSNNKRRVHSPRERGRFVQLEEGHDFQGRRGSIQLKDTISKRRRGHAFPEIAALNVELTAIRKEVVSLHRDIEIEARWWHDFLIVLLYKISAEQYCLSAQNSRLYLLLKGLYIAENEVCFVLILAHKSRKSVGIYF
jgi:hypothetical protein